MGEEGIILDCCGGALKVVFPVDFSCSGGQCWIGVIDS